MLLTAPLTTPPLTGSLLIAAGMEHTELITESPEAYVAQAVALAGNATRVAELRQMLVDNRTE
jgi:predicted O-linked N-acetylglucosamine transferase (SPINDLY family)